MPAEPMPPTAVSMSRHVAVAVGPGGHTFRLFGCFGGLPAPAGMAVIAFPKRTTYNPYLEHGERCQMSMSEPNDRSAHWDQIYQQKSSTAVGWYRSHLETSLRLLAESGLDASSRVIDIGGGASTLVDDLICLGVGAVTVLDLSAASLQVSQERLGTRADQITWLTSDITRIALPEAGFTHWHDRAVMHFLTDAQDVRAYAAQAASAVVPGGHAVIGGFAPDGPERCSGLPVVRRSAEDIAAVLGPSFQLITTAAEVHVTPGGTAQSFIYALLRRI